MNEDLPPGIRASRAHAVPWRIEPQKGQLAYSILVVGCGFSHGPENYLQNILWKSKVGESS
jgi:hypothetical protein